VGSFKVRLQHSAAPAAASGVKRIAISNGGGNDDGGVKTFLTRLRQVLLQLAETWKAL
jgi:hypothetical protein